ncbi:MAG: Heteropolysaccharide repeat unit export protein [Berkelbacteria bacterium GW2011_GWA2_35_9]|uniref:Heteropolysaccharide repeat unit export protein n=1 Tax=Berkelbacteria bacterium GW2011_GWA2_35_9 TaxID=1618333 RepID=A0A0G0D6S3_9BACT|nr:MAG: Heteropolysaccharide repeat unit export protein [Berkelbacteria bacterium GW2011_GWA2_35_9]
MLYSKIISHNTLIMLSGRVINLIITAVLIALITRYLGVAGFGQYSTILSYILLFGVLSDFGLHNTVTRKIATSETEDRDQISRFYIFKIILSLIVYSTSVVIAWTLGYENIIKIGITIFSVAGISTALFAFNSALYHGKLKVKQFVLADVIGRLIILIGVYFSIKNDLGLLGIISGYVAGDIFTYILSFIWLKKIIPFNFKTDFSWNHFISIVKESFPLGIVMILTTIYFRSDIVVLSLLKPDFDVGIYGASVKIIDIILSFPVVFLAVTYPIMAIITKKDRLYFNQNLQKIINFMLLSATPIVIFGIIKSSQIIRIVAGYDFVNSSTVIFLGNNITTPTILSILLIAVFFVFLHQVFYYMLIASGKQNILLIPVILYVLLNVFLNIIFVPAYSYFASSVITLLNEIIVLIVVYNLSKKIFEHRINFKILLVSIISLLPSTLFLLATNQLFYGTIYSVIWQLFLALIIYLVMLYWFKVFNLKNLKKLV